MDLRLKKIYFTLFCFFRKLLHALLGHYERAPRSKYLDEGEDGIKDTQESANIALLLLLNRFLWFVNVH